MYHGLHLTRKVERDAIREKPFDLITVSPLDIHGKDPHKPIVWEEDSGKFYEHDISAFLETLELIDKEWKLGGQSGDIDLSNSPYMRKWRYKGMETQTRLRKLPDLYKSIKEEGIHTPIDVEATGERIDGSFRSKIALHLGIKEIPAKLYRFHWKDVTEDFLERKIKGHWLSTGKEYYDFAYGYKDWRNIPAGGGVYAENAADRWEVISPLLVGEVLDLGCNEGYLSIQAALKGHEVVGIDHNCIQGANLNKLVFEWIHEFDLPVTFRDGNVEDVVVPEDTDTVLALCVLYHLPREKQIQILRQCKGKKVIIQCNLRKEKEREKYWSSHPDDAIELIRLAGLSLKKRIDWRDKPILIAS